MMSGTNSPDIDPTNNQSLAGTIRYAFGKMLQNVNGMLPARVMAYDRTKNRVQVEILILIITTDGSQVSRGQIASLPVMLLGGGEFFLSFNLKEGDLGWIVANDRDISLFLQSYTTARPNTNRVKNFADAVFIPDIMKGYTIDLEDAENCVLQNLDGSVKISLGTDTITIKAPNIVLEGNVTTTGDLNIEGGMTAQAGISGIINLTGNLAVDGNITATGSITPGV